MTRMRYHEVIPISRSAAEKAFSSTDPDIICDALIRVTFHDSDSQWVEDRCVKFLQHKETDVRGLAITCLGHLARIHGKLNVDRVRPLLEALLNDPHLAGRARDALDDIKTYM